ncbi:MAG: circadian clock protein KaiC [Aquisalimonadaceae bacterium]
MMEKQATGIDMFDAITHGGLPQRHLTLISGAPGSGKTVLALQILAQSAHKHDERAVFVAFEECTSMLMDTSTGFDWNLAGLVDSHIAMVDADVNSFELASRSFDIGGLLATAQARAESMNASRVVFDGIDVLLGLLQDRRDAQRELYRLRAWLRETGLTIIITAKDENDTPLYGAYPGFLDYVADCVIHLGFRGTNRAELFQRSLQILKYRGSAHPSHPIPFVVTERGLELLCGSDIRFTHPVFLNRLPTGVKELDEMLDGGYLQGSSTLISGVPGTAKTTLASAFAAAAAARGEPTLLVSFDEAEDQIIRNVRSVGLDLSTPRDAGLLHIVSLRASGASAEQRFITIRRLIEDVQPRHLIVDPLSALVKASGEEVAGTVADELLVRCKQLGMTVIMTTLLGGAGAAEETDSHISTIADNWINLSYNILGGERNRALTVIKARGTAHSNQVRELILEHAGLRLEDVYTSGGSVLMGTARMEREHNERELERHRIEEHDRFVHELENGIHAMQEQQRELSRQLDKQEAALSAAIQSEAERQSERGGLHHSIRSSRSRSRTNDEQTSGEDC